MSTLRRALALAALALALLPVGCGRSGGGGGGTTLVYARGSASKTLDPAEATDGESALVLENVYDTLVRYRNGTRELEPALATSWKAAEDGRSLVLTLREGVVFHDGTPFDAAAVVDNFERQRDLTHRFHYTDPGQPPPRYAYWSDMFGAVARTVADGPRTVRIEFAEPMPPFFVALLAMFNCCIVSPAALGKGRDFVKRHPVGTGAFRWGGIDGADEVTLEANPAWWGGRPKVDRVVLTVVPDLRSMYARLEAGQVDGIDNVAAKDVVRARGNRDLTVHQVDAGLSICYLALHHGRAPFDDVRVRRAVALAVDKPRIVATAYEGLATPLATAVPPGIEGSAPVPDRPRDVKEARRLLEEAGALGAKVTLRVMSNPRPYLPDPAALAAALRDDLRDAGLEVEIVKGEWAHHLQAMQQGDHQLGVLGWTADVADADNYLYVLLSKESAVPPANNVSFYRSDRFQALVAAARRTYDAGERRRLYADAQRLAHDDVAFVPLVVMPRTAVTRADVEGFRLDPVSSPRFAWTSKRR